jgi:GNAT superfamily N-acetyltransferase
LYTFRDAQPGDDAGVQRVVGVVLREYGMELDIADTDRDLVDIFASYTKRGGVFRVLVDKAGHIVGCGGLYPLSGHEAAIRKMYLLPMARRHGLGRALLQTLIEAARAKGVHRVSLETNSVLREAITLYRSFGFTEIALTTEHAGSNKPPRADQAFALDLVHVP